MPIFITILLFTPDGTKTHNLRLRRRVAHVLATRATVDREWVDTNVNFQGHAYVNVPEWI